MTTEKKTREREWKMEPVTEFVKDKDGFDYPVEKILVTFRDHQWSLPNSPAGRDEAMRRINVIRGRDEVTKSLEHIKKRVISITGEIGRDRLGDDSTDRVVDVLSMVEGNLTDALIELNGGLKP